MAVEEDLNTLFFKKFVMRAILMKIPIQQRYQFIRDFYQMLNQNSPLTVEILQISKNTLSNALTILNSKQLFMKLKSKKSI